MPTPDILCALGLGIWLVAAAASDIRTRRIPNKLVAGGMLCGLALQSLAPAGNGLFSAAWGGLGLGWALLGMLAGLALFMPLHLLRVLGAGDVKLLAMVGVWLGPRLLLGATLTTLLAGGLLAIAAMLIARRSREVLGNVRMLLTTLVLGLPAGRVPPLHLAAGHGARLPYALAIALGTLAQLAWLFLQRAP